MKRLFAFAVGSFLAALLAPMSGCKEKDPSPPAPSAVAPDVGPGPGSGPASGPSAMSAGHGGAVIRLGTSTIGPFQVIATRDDGELMPGKDAPIDVTVTPVAGSSAQVTAVRFWIGTESAKGSAKARADVENAGEPNRWHTHAEIPTPIPTGSKLWVEIEDDQGGRSVGSFELQG